MVNTSIFEIQKGQKATFSEFNESDFQDLFSLFSKKHFY
jgi:hypothetical protein